MWTCMHHGRQGSMLPSSCPSIMSLHMQYWLWWLLPNPTMLHPYRDANLHEDHPSSLPYHANDQKNGQMLQTRHVLCGEGIRSMCLRNGTPNQDGEMLQTCVHHGNRHQDRMLPWDRDLHRVCGASPTCMHYGSLQHRVLLNSYERFLRTYNLSSGLIEWRDEIFEWFLTYDCCI